MPRIAATLGLFGLVVLALGLNIAQFPLGYQAPSPSMVSAEPEEVGSTHESTPPPMVALKPAEEKPVQVRREPEQATPRSGGLEEEQESDEEVPERHGASSDGEDEISQEYEEKPAATENTESDRAEHELEYSEDVGESSKPAPATGADEEPDFTGMSDDEAIKPGSDSRRSAGPASETTRQFLSDSMDPALKPMEPYTAPAMGGIYNPLEPQPELAGTAPPEAEATPANPVAPPVPAEAVPSPPYAAAGSGFITEGRAMVPIEPSPANEPQQSGPAEQVIRLPSPGNVWPGVPATPFPSDDWLPAEGYPTTETMEE